MNNTEEEEKIQQAIDLGVPQHLARQALELSSWNVNNAANTYYDGLINTTDTQPIIRHNRMQNYLDTPGPPFIDYFTEKDLEKLKEIKVKPKECGNVKIRLSDEKTPELEPLPLNKTEYLMRFEAFESTLEERKVDFLRKRIKGYFDARNEYYEALRHIFFVALNPFEDIAKLDEDYDDYKHVRILKRIMIAVRKIAECDYFLGLYEESMRICRTNLYIGRVFEEFLNGINDEVRRKKVFAHPAGKMTRLTYGIMGRIMICCGKFEKAKEYIETGGCQQSQE